MAADFVVTTGKQALAAGAAQTVMLLNPVTNRAAWIAFDISFDASSVSNGIEADLYRITTLGAAAGTATTVKKCDEDTQAATTTALTMLTTEPTAVDVLAGWLIQPVGGLYTLQGPLGREPAVMKGGGSRMGLRLTTPTGVAPNAIVNVWLEE